MKAAGRTLILIFLFVFTIHEVSGNSFLYDSGFNKHHAGRTDYRGGSYQNLQSHIALNNWLSAAEENDESPEETLSGTWHPTFAKHLFYLFDGLVGSDSPRPVPQLKNASIITSPIIVPRYILYHSLRIHAA